MEKDKYMPNPSSASAVGAPQQHQQPECDYDMNPTVLYQAIEAKQWDYAVTLFKANKCAKQSATWVVRKETNGKLRWRLLPLHAAVIFGSPLPLVECLLEDYPTAAQCKDDQGMLPLHLAFRNEGTSSWEIIEELLTAYPQAIFVKDRKGRTPLDCGIQLSGNNSSSVSVSSAPQQSKTFKSIVGVLDLYSQVVVSAEKRRAQQEARKQMEARIAQMQDSHLQTLTRLKQEWSTQQEESKKQVAALKEERQALETTVNSQEITIDALRGTEANLQEKLENMAVVLKQQGKAANSNARKNDVTNDLLRSMVQDLVDQQQDYHKQFNNLMVNYEKLLNERKVIQQVFISESDQHLVRETRVVDSFKEWLREKEQKLRKQKGLVDDEEHQGSEEKKVENVHDFVERYAGQGPKMAPLSIGSGNSEAATVIDLSDMESEQ